MNIANHNSGALRARKVRLILPDRDDMRFGVSSRTEVYCTCCHVEDDCIAQKDTASLQRPQTRSTKETGYLSPDGPCAR